MMSSDSTAVGVVTRTFSSTPGSKTINYFLTTHGRQTWAPDPDTAERLVGTTPVGAAIGGHLLIWDGALPHVATDDDAIRFFTGNTLAEQPRAPLTYIDATLAPPLDDDDFWAIIDLLDRSTSERSIAKATRVVCERGRDFALRYEQTAALKSLALVGSLRSRGVDWIGDDAEWVALGAVLTQGRATYEGVLAGSVEFSTKWLRDSSSAALFLGSNALDRIDRSEYIVTTAYTPRHRQLLGFGDDGDGDEFDSANGFAVLVAARGVVHQSHLFKERVVIATVRTADEIGEAAAAIESFGGRLVAGPELDGEYRNVNLQTGRVFSTRHRSRATDDAFLRERSSV